VGRLDARLTPALAGLRKLKSSSPSAHGALVSYKGVSLPERIATDKNRRSRRVIAILIVLFAPSSWRCSSSAGPGDHNPAFELLEYAVDRVFFYQCWKESCGRWHASMDETKAKR
jgi:hypothetical protein